MTHQKINLNIRYDASEVIWDKIPMIYEQLNGWLGFSTGADYGEKGIPYWFGFNVNKKHISASVEPSRLHFTGLIDSDEWIIWVKEIKNIATRELGFKVGEIESGEVDF